MNITIFKNIKETSAPFVRSVDVILERIKNGKSKDLIVKIRKEKDKDARNILKQDLPAICFSGVFFKREDKAIETHSGLICLDFDGFKTKKAMQEKKKQLSKDKFIYSVFVSPSGNGLKVLVKIPGDIENHCSYFQALEDYFGCEEFDKSCKNISRVCYESYDPDLYINDNSDVWEEKAQEETAYVRSYESKPTIRVSDENDIVKKLITWWEKKYGIVEGQRNNNMFILAAALNEFGVSKSLCNYILPQYAHKGFTEAEIRNVIDSAYRNTAVFGTKFFENTPAIDNVRQKIKKGASQSEIKNDLMDAGVKVEEMEEVIEEIRTDPTRTQFWSINSRGSVSIVHHLFKEFLEDNGFYKFSPKGSTAIMFVRVKDNLISNVSVEFVKDFVLQYIHSYGDMMVYNHFADKTRYFKEDFLGMLESIDAFFIKDTKDIAYIYYKNCAVKVSAKNVEMVDYIDLGGYVWKDQVIDREFTLSEDTDCDYKQFIHNVAGDNETNIASIESTIGFLLHGFKNQSYCPAVVINDEIISLDTPEGGTGKGLFVNGISQMKNVVTIDGKSFNFEKSFAYQLVSQDTQTLCFDDVKKSFHFERLFSVVTEGITLEKKNRDAIKISFEDSPKIIITTNYAIVGKGNSFERRKWELEFVQYYNKNFTPLDEFGKLLFTDWDAEEWLRFDSYMIGCLKSYLKTGFIDSEFKNMGERKFQAATHPAFYDWITNPLNNREIDTEVKIYQHTMWASFTAEYSNFDRMNITPQKFGKWLLEYAYFRTGIEAAVGRDRNGKFFIINVKMEEEEEVPF
tara:strand:- start:1057 stop:3447 length:2391 start_codon:yes stop_codon:yes gene_type:complete